MLVTFFMPTRHRPSKAQEAIKALNETCSGNPLTTYHVVGYLDEDEPQLDQYKAIFYPPASYVVGKRYGYANLHLAVSEKLLLFADGCDWVVFWNDDAIMTTQGWDKILEAEQPDYVLCPQTPQDAHNGAPNTFPFVPRKWVDVAGWAKNGANDTWWEVVGKMITRHKNVNISLEHTPTDSAKQGYDSRTFFNIDNYANMGYAAGRIQQKFYAK